MKKVTVKLVKVKVSKKEMEDAYESGLPCTRCYLDQEKCNHECGGGMRSYLIVVPKKVEDWL